MHLKRDLAESYMISLMKGLPELYMICFRHYMKDKHVKLTPAHGLVTTRIWKERTFRTVVFSPKKLLLHVLNGGASFAKS